MNEPKCRVFKADSSISFSKRTVSRHFIWPWKRFKWSYHFIAIVFTMSIQHTSFCVLMTFSGFRYLVLSSCQVFIHKRVLSFITYCTLSFCSICVTLCSRIFYHFWIGPLLDECNYTNTNTLLRYFLLCQGIAKKCQRDNSKEKV